MIGKNVDFVLKGKIIDDSYRYVILLCEISGLTVLLLNTYAPNTASAQVTFFTELWGILSKLDNIDNIIWGGDFNCSFDKLDAVGGNFKPKRKSLYLIQEIMDCYDMCDIWRVRNESKRQYTWRQKSPLIERRLDFFLVSNTLQSIISKANIIMLFVQITLL